MALVYGDNQIFEDTRSAIKTLMDSLRTAMASDSPKLEGVYDGHLQVKMSLPSVSIDFDGFQAVGNQSGRSAGVGSAITETYIVRISLRVHTAYDIDSIDGVKLSRLMNSVNNYIMTHRKLFITGFSRLEILSGEVNKRFNESLTLGGEVKLGIIITVFHQQGV